jgi:hypothetical protein
MGEERAALLLSLQNLTRFIEDWTPLSPEDYEEVDRMLNRPKDSGE